MRGNENRMADKTVVLALSIIRSYLGKSTGKGALSIWTHNLNSVEPLLNYRSPTYNGPALKMGAGVTGDAAYAAAHKLGFRVVGGYSPTVGVAGGYTLGGGTSALTQLHGLGADNVLEWEVVTANGTHARASPHENPDLYWALSGGGGGTYAVVVSMTARLHRDAGPTSGALLAINTSSWAQAGDDAVWAAVNEAHAHLAPIVDSGANFVTIVANGTAAFALTALG
jgi:FAD/FMN-containing dehydrogenase